MLSVTLGGAGSRCLPGASGPNWGLHRAWRAAEARVADFRSASVTFVFCLCRYYCFTVVSLSTLNLVSHLFFCILACNLHLYNTTDYCVYVRVENLFQWLLISGIVAIAARLGFSSYFPPLIFTSLLLLDSFLKSIFSPSSTESFCSSLPSVSAFHAVNEHLSPKIKWLGFLNANTRTQ